MSGVAAPREPRSSIVRRGRVSWLTHPPTGVARVSVESEAFGHLPVSLPDGAPIPHEATPGELLAIAYGMFLAVALSEDLLDAEKPADQIVVEAACSFDGPPSHRELTTLELSVFGRVPALDQEGFSQAVTAARADALRAVGARDDLPGRLEAVLESPG